MIKHTELRLNNRLQPKEEHKASYGDNEAFVTLIQEDKFTVCNHYPGKWFEPIPLSEQWLIRVGYRKHNNAWVPPNFSGNFMGDWQFTIYDYGHKMTYNSAEFEVELKSVHQLQNLYFALTGEELTFKDL